MTSTNYESAIIRNNNDCKTKQYVKTHNNGEKNSNNGKKKKLCQ